MSYSVLRRRDAIDACRSTLRAIKRSRRELRKQYLASYMESATWRWKWLWWLGFSKPTRRSALNWYYHGHPRFPASVEVGLTYAIQENRCKELLALCNHTAEHVVFWSTEDCYTCNLGGIDVQA